MTRSSDNFLSGRYWACALNYNEYAKKLFGKRHALDSYLTYSIQFVELAAEQVAGPCRAAQIPERIRSDIPAFDGGLSHDEYNSPKFSYRLLFKRKLVNKLRRSPTSWPTRFRQVRSSETRPWRSSPGRDRTFTLAKKYKIKTAFGTDILFSPRLAQRHGELLTMLVRWYTPAETLVMATGTNAQLLAMSGSAIRTPASLAWSRRARSPTSCSWTAIPSRTSSCSRIRKKTSSSS